MLTKKDKKKWVDALRSGKYKQGKNSLYNETNKAFCCLGVMRQVCESAKGEGYDVLDIDFENKLIGFNDGVKNYPNRGKRYKQKSFKWIAAYIERYL